ncbi:hypothetical protein WJ973_23850 [Achromobacter xylosoxidans]
MTQQDDIAQRVLTTAQRNEFIRRTSFISENDRETRASFVDEIAHAALASAPVADEPTLFESWWASEIAANGGATIGADYRHWALRGWLARAPVAGEAHEPVAVTDHQGDVHWRHGRKAGIALYAAPQASDTVGLLRKAAEALAGYRREMSLLRPVDIQPCDAERAIIAALKTLADKDGGQQRAAEASAPDTAKDRVDKILRERMAPISEALGLDVMLASAGNGVIQIFTFKGGPLVYTIRADGTAILRVSWNQPDAPDTLTVDQVKIITQGVSETQPEPQPARTAVAGEVVGWAAVPSRGKRAGRIYCTCDTREQIDAYIEQVHQSNDSLTLWARPLSFADAAPQANAKDVRNV